MKTMHKFMVSLEYDDDDHDYEMTFQTNQEWGPGDFDSFLSTTGCLEAAELLYGEDHVSFTVWRDVNGTWEPYN